MVDMRYNLAVGVIIALGGAALVRSMRTKKVSRRRWLPAVAFISGPLITVGSQVFDICCVSKFTHPDDVIPMIVAATAIGLVAGGVAAIAFWIIER